MNEIKRLLESEAEETIQRQSAECAAEEIEKLGELAVTPPQSSSPTVESQRQWDRIRWGIE